MSDFPKDIMTQEAIKTGGILVMLFLFVGLLAFSAGYFSVEPEVEPPEQLPEIEFSEIIRDYRKIPGYSLENNTKLRNERIRDDYERSLLGKRIEWEGTVTDATPYPPRYFLSISMDNQTPPIDVYLYVDEEKALIPNVGDTVKFTGEIKGLWPNLFFLDTVEVYGKSVEVIKKE